MNLFTIILHSLSVGQIIFLAYLIILNTLTFGVYGADKSFAVTGHRRVRERTLLLLAFCGGSAGALAATQFFRHKRQKGVFFIPLLIIFTLHIGATWLILTYFHSPTLDALPQVF